MSPHAHLPGNLLLILAASVTLLHGQAPISELRVEGAKRHSPEATVAAAGLQLNAIVSRKDLDDASQRLVDSGFYRSANYRYQPRAGDGRSTYAVTLEVVEEAATLPVVFDVANVDEAKLWKELKTSHPLVAELIPDSERTISYCRLAVENVLERWGQRQQIVSQNEADLATGRMAVVLRPAKAPKIAGFKFTGHRAMASGALSTIVERLLNGRAYSERDIRFVLEQNLKPAYEERGMLTAKFPGVRAVSSQDGTVDVAIEIDEGPVWTLGKVDIVGNDLPLDAMRAAGHFAVRNPADWKKFKAAIAAMEQPLRSDGYIRVSSNPVLSFRTEGFVVDVTVRVSKGQQFVLGTVQLDGLTAAEQIKAAKLCKLRAGEPLNESYLDEYSKKVFEVAARRPASVSRLLRSRPGTNVVDVVLSYR
jgi:outer membrane protein insertion porin family